MRYRNIDLELAREGDRFRLTLRGAAAPVDLRVEPFAADFEADLARLAEGDGDEGYFRDFGVRLYRALFPDPASRMLVRAIDHQRLRDGGVCIRLRLQDAAARALPWEFLFRPDWRRYLAASVESPLVRYLDVPRPIAELKVRPPLRVLVVAPESARHSPSGALDAGREIAGLREAIASLGGLASLDVLDRDATFEHLRDALIGTRYHVLHFIGHGRFDGGEARLVFDRAGGGEEGVREARLAELLVNHPSIKLAFLNACESAAVGNTESVHGMAPRLVEAGVPAVVAMQYQVRDDAAIAFSRVFYHSLFQGADRGRVDVAMSHARSALVGDYGDQREFGAPVLYLRAPAGLLFDAETAQDARQRVIRGDEIGRATAVEQTLTNNVALGELGDRTALSSLRRTFARSNLLRACAVMVLFGALLAPGFVRWIEYKLDLVVVAMRDTARPPSWHPSLQLVDLGETAGAAAGSASNPQPDRRGNFARLIDRLSAAQAKSIAFYFNLGGDRPSDGMLVEAIARARERGTHVVFAPGRKGDGADETTLKADFVKAGARWGIGCIQLDAHLFSASFALSAPAPNPADPPRPSFGLVAAFPDLNIARDDEVGRALILRGADSTGVASDERTLRYSVEGKAKPFDEGDTKACTLIPGGSRTADMYIEFPPRAELHTRMASLPRLIASTDLDVTRYRGAVVMVGEHLPAERNDAKADAGIFLKVPRLIRDEEWPSHLITAAAINTILNGVAVRPIPTSGQLLAVCMALLLAALFGSWRTDATMGSGVLEANGDERVSRAWRWLAAVSCWLALMLVAGCVILLIRNEVFPVWYASLAAWIGQEAGAYLRTRWLFRSKVG